MRYIHYVEDGDTYTGIFEHLKPVSKKHCSGGKNIYLLLVT